MTAARAKIVDPQPTHSSTAVEGTDCAIRVSNVTKYYKIYQNFITGPIKERIFFWRADRYFRRFKALSDVTLDVRRGEIVGVIGPNGSGKTTLLKSIAGLAPVDDGDITVNGTIT